MGLVVNPRGAGGAGKTALARQVMAEYYGWPRDGRVTPIRPGRHERPIGYRLADAFASAGHDVLLEGLRLSGEHRRSAALAEAHAVHVLRLDTPLERCVRNLVARRRARRSTWPRIAGAVAAMDREVEEACRRLQESGAGIEVLGFDAALRRARNLLGLHQGSSRKPRGQDRSGQR